MEIKSIPGFLKGLQFGHLLKLISHFEYIITIQALFTKYKLLNETAGLEQFAKTEPL